MRIGELALAILKRGGLSDAQAVAAFSGVIAINYGWASFTAARDLDPAGPSHDVEAMLLQLPAAVFPLTVADRRRSGAPTAATRTTSSCSGGSSDGLAA